MPVSKREPGKFTRTPALAAAIALLVGPFAAACGGSDCLSIARRYSDEGAYALTCDPNDPNPCSAERPVVLYEQNGTQLTLEGLGTCTHSDNAARVAKLDQILAEFYASGCKLAQVPFCPAVGRDCVASSPGHYTCAP